MRLALLWCTLALPAFALGPFEKNHPLVAEGMAAYQEGDYQRALEKFEEAKKELPKSAALEFNRGNALFKLGRFDEARQAYHHVSDLDQGELKQRDFYNLGNAWAATQNQKEAIAAYRKALVLDPRDALARHNLEVLLRKLPPPQQDGPDGGTPDAGTPDAGSGDAGRPDAGPDAGLRDGGQDAGSDGGSGDAGTGDAGQDGGTDGGSGDGGGDGGSPRQGGDGGQDGGGDGGKQGEKDRPGDGGERGQDPSGDGGFDGGSQRDGGLDGGGGSAEDSARDGGTSQEDLNRKQTEKLLDSMKNNEKNLQLWRFQQKKQRKVNDKDW